MKNIHKSLIYNRFLKICLPSCNSEMIATHKCIINNNPTMLYKKIRLTRIIPYTSLALFLLTLKSLV